MLKCIVHIFIALYLFTSCGDEQEEAVTQLSDLNKNLKERLAKCEHEKLSLQKAMEEKEGSIEKEIEFNEYNLKQPAIDKVVIISPTTQQADNNVCDATLLWTDPGIKTLERYAPSTTSNCSGGPRELVFTFQGALFTRAYVTTFDTGDREWRAFIKNTSPRDKKVEVSFCKHPENTGEHILHLVKPNGDICKIIFR